MSSAVYQVVHVQSSITSTSFYTQNMSQNGVMATLLHKKYSCVVLVVPGECAFLPNLLFNGKSSFCHTIQLLSGNRISLVTASELASNSEYVVRPLV